jgi:transposase
MEYIKGNPREQITLYPSSLDEIIDANNTVRFIDGFVNTLNFEELGFEIGKNDGRNAYAPADLLKLYIYGYMNRIRSSRTLETECHRNIEVIWLLKNLKPDHNTIARFRKNNPKAIKRVFHKTVKIAQHFNLIGGLLIAGDSTKLRAQNSKKNNFNELKIERHLEYIDNKLADFEREVSDADGKLSDERVAEIKVNVDRHKKFKTKYKKIEQQLKDGKKEGLKQISTSDPDSRHQVIRNGITEVSYSLQTTVDEKNNIPIDYKLTNNNDVKAMGMMLRRAKTILRSNEFIGIYDKGYHTGSEFSIANSLKIKTVVAIPSIGRPSQAPNPTYNSEHFIYNKENDTYTCPENQTLTTTGTQHKAHNYLFKQYRTSACLTCQVREQCTRAKSKKKLIQRSEHTEVIALNAKNVAENEKLYKKRQAIVEHPFGTIKRQWGFDHIMTKKGINRASADVGLIMIVYNLKRIMNLVKVEELNQVIRDLIQLIGNKKRAIKLVLTIISLINVKRSTSQLFLIRIQITIQNSIFTNQLSSF